MKANNKMINKSTSKRKFMSRVQLKTLGISSSMTALMSNLAFGLALSHIFFIIAINNPFSKKHSTNIDDLLRTFSLKASQFVNPFNVIISSV